MHIRIGFHYGDVICEAGDVFGDTVNIAARVAAITRARQIITTRAVTDALLATGNYRVIADQDTLWKRSSGKDTRVVMVLYATSREFASKHPELLRDINDAQREAVELWAKRPDVAGRAIAQVTGLPKDVVELAMRNTKTMLHGLSEESIDTMLEQLKIARQHGTILQSDVWVAPESAKKLRQELFYVPK